MCNTCRRNVTDGNRHLLAEFDVRHAASHAHPHAGAEAHSHDHAHDHEHTHAVEVLQSLLDHNDPHADQNRARLDQHKILTINLMSSPGSGKTALLEATIRALGRKLRLGHHLNVALHSVTEADDKPAKYPVMFCAADLMIVSKTDLLPYLEEFSVDRAEGCFWKLASGADLLRVSAKTGEGIADWLAWLGSTRAAYLELLSKRDQFNPRLRTSETASV